jgi:hypothetical protein
MSNDYIFCDICEVEVEGDYYGFDLLLKDGEEITIGGCESCVRQMHKDVTGEVFPNNSEFE